METILPLVIAAIVFGFQIYANFKKEQEKARKRNPSQKPVPKEVPERERQIKKYGKTVTQRETVLNHPIPKPAYEKYTGMADEVEEVRRARAIHKPHQHAFKRLEAFALPDEEKEYNAHVDFDLRDAIIKAAILERPYK